MATKKKLTERQRFERWYRRAHGRAATTSIEDVELYFEVQAMWQGWQASARAKR